MALDYKNIRKDHETYYGTRVPQYGKRFFEDMYADRTHFIFELLQNAEDALGRRGNDWDGSRAVSFRLYPNHLRVGHFGDPFNERDVRSICSIDDSTKKDSLTEIGRFGVGFKSVYAFTDRPEVHSGPEDFAIDHYVWPRGIEPLERKSHDETVFVLQFREDAPTAYSDINDGLKDIGIQTLLFLRQIEEISWQNDDGGSGHYLRETETVDEGVLRTTLIAQVDGEPEVASQEWLVFHDQVEGDESYPDGRVEIAFLIDPESGEFQEVEDPTLFAYFPTQRAMQCGFLLNGPFRTTLNRENVPDHDEWNQRLVLGAASLLVKSLRWLRDKGQLNAAVLRCLPLRPRIAVLGHMARYLLLEPLFEQVRDALSSEPLLPRLGGGYIRAKRARMGRTEALRLLFSPEQLSYIFYGVEVELAWLDPGISQDYVLLEYVAKHLNVEEIRPETIIPRLSLEFLQGQSDEWIRRLYEFLQGQRAQVQRVGLIPVVRLEDGTQVRASVNGRVQAYLPTGYVTGFPTVARAVCGSPEARQFLRSLGLSEPDAVDDVLINLIPEYEGDRSGIGDDKYEADILRVLKAFESSTGDRRVRLTSALRTTAFVKLVDLESPDSQGWGLPSLAYLPTEELTELFSGISGVRFVDRTYPCLRGERIDQLLETCGSLSTLSAIQFDNRERFSRSERIQMRVKTQRSDGSTRAESVTDWRIRGLESLLNSLSELEPYERSLKSKLLWRALCALDSSQFAGRYSWFYYNKQSCSFQSEFVDLLNRVAWIPTSDGNLDQPSKVIFEDLDWEENGFLQSQILFRPSTIRVLAEEAGLQEELLGELLDLGIRTLPELRELIGEQPDESQHSGSPVGKSTDIGTAGIRSNSGAPPVHSGVPVTMGGDSGPPDGGSGMAAGQKDAPEVPFAARLYEVQSINPSSASSNPPVFPVGGPRTSQSARHYTRRSALFGRTEATVLRTVTTTDLGPGGRGIAEEFRDMVEGDYGKRCQICSRTFVRTGGGWQVNVVHVVPFSTDSRANNFGDLLGLCGWHFSLMQYGEWALLDPLTDRPFVDRDGSIGWELMRSFILNRAPDVDDQGNPYVGLPVRFSNVYEEWEAEPATVDEQIRYSIPHWKFLRALLEV